MKWFGLAIALSAASLSPLALSEGRSDPIYGRMIQANEQSMQDYAFDRGKTPPKVTHYQYGMKLDVGRVIHITRVDYSCNAQPAQMTYEDSHGELKILEYRKMGECRTHG